jgi:hypothetical protein
VPPLDPSAADRQALAGLIAKDEIRDVLLRYCRGIDRRDRRLLRDSFHLDALDNHGNFRGTGFEFVDWAIERLARRPQVTTHVVTNALIDLDGESANVESYFIGVHVIVEADGRHVTHEFHGRYLDRFERRDGRWAISRRQVVHDWNETRTIAPAQDPTDPRFHRGRPYPNDLVYSEASAGSTRFPTSS